MERRKKPSVDPIWHDALKSVHRRLVDFEEANQRLAASEESFQRVLGFSSIGFFRADGEGKLLGINPTMARICGYESAEQMLAEGRIFGGSLFAEPGQWEEFLRGLEADDEQAGLVMEATAPDGKRNWIELKVRATYEDEVLEYEGTAVDITERKRTEDRLRRLAYFDSITGLPNRPFFEETLEDALSGARRSGRCGALMVLEIGQFRMINSSFGKSFGDHLLKETAERIMTAVGKGCTAARLAGAEFAILLDGIECGAKVEEIAKRVLATVNAGFRLLGNTLNISSIVGISMYPRDGNEGQLLLERAEVAMYSAKDTPGSTHQFFTEEMNRRLVDRLRLENGLRLALERNELYLVYQPQVDIRTWDISGLEALIRWRHPELGVVPPAEFIGIAESSGLIVSIGEWVLRTACAQARKWQESGLRPVPVAVNVSAVQFCQEGFCELIRRVLEETGLDPSYLELELTERVLLSNADLMLILVQELHEMGIRLAIDDFGTGYSSLSYLRQFKVDRLKIDRSFVQDISVNADDAAITTAIINMARALHLEVLAEGVETVDQLGFLQALNCFSMQGYYFSKPVEVHEIGANLKKRYAQ